MQGRQENAFTVPWRPLGLTVVGVGVAQSWLGACKGSNSEGPRGPARAPRQVAAPPGVSCSLAFPGASSAGSATVARGSLLSSLLGLPLRPWRC